MKQRVLKTITEHRLISPGDRVLLALSGGSDSVCLLHVLYELRELLHFELFACHLNHEIREEADRDMDFVQSLCASLGVKCFVKRADIREIARKHKISEELAGRNERYDFFSQVATDNDINLIATAHNKNDAAETILMHLIRGCGIDGLTGIAYKRENIIRPLLDAKKEDIERFCRSNGYEFVTDKTNSETLYTRNKIRLELLPKINDELNPAFIDVVVKNSHIIKGDADFLNEVADKAYTDISKGDRLCVEKLQKLPTAIARRVIIKAIKTCLNSTQNVQSVYVENILKLVEKGKSGSSADVGGGFRCAIESGQLLFKVSTDVEKEYCYQLELNKRIYIKEAGVGITLIEWSGEGERFYFDALKELYVRNRRRGDVFYPVGMKGKKKLSDYFIDCKIPLSARAVIPIIFCGTDLVWIVGKRRDSRFQNGNKAYTFIID